MDQAEGVDVVERPGELHEHVDDDLARLALEEVREIDALDQLLGEEHPLELVAAPELVDRGQVRVVQLREQPKLFFEGFGDVVGLGGGAGPKVAAHPAGSPAPTKARARGRGRAVEPFRAGPTRVHARIRADDLERHLAILELVLGAIDGAEASLPEELLNEVAPRDLFRDLAHQRVAALAAAGL
ncbi:hypothetical protein [Pseudenhygromyxa sp. WMMC2535]|uniref:hypothetical protein n=1 Tax=Pseudenhygromyxa sp. WMMC2535 TaxID=2712867 RepID=UPI0020D0D837|nr:hypothetical protein [Pseudenhygromyxa sp. WMMC2535]